MSVPIFTKSELLTDCVFDLDDFYYRYNRNALSELFYLKTLYPAMKVTLFTVPDYVDSPIRNMHDFISLVSRHADWIQLACHGLHHMSPEEALGWTEEQTHDCLNKWEQFGTDDFIQKGFKAPNWNINKSVYEVLLKRGYWVADHPKNDEIRPKKLKAYTLDHPWILHGHTWDLPNEDPVYKNGVRQMIEIHKLPWNKHTNFHFISEVI